MARRKGSKDIKKRKARKSDYETYLTWVKTYGGKTPLSKEEFQEAKELKKLELKDLGKSTTNLSRQLAQETSFTYSYETGRAIKKAYKEMGYGKIEISDARRLMEYDAQGHAIKHDETFWSSVSDYYSELTKTHSTSEAKEVISQTIFGSP